MKDKVIDDHTTVSNEEIINCMSNIKLENAGKHLFAYISLLDKNLEKYKKMTDFYKIKIKRINELEKRNHELIEENIKLKNEIKEIKIYNLVNEFETILKYKKSDLLLDHLSKLNIHNTIFSI